MPAEAGSRLSGILSRYGERPELDLRHAPPGRKYRRIARWIQAWTSHSASVAEGSARRSSPRSSPSIVASTASGSLRRAGKRGVDTALEFVVIAHRAVSISRIRSALRSGPSAPASRWTPGSYEARSPGGASSCRVRSTMLAAALGERRCARRRARRSRPRPRIVRAVVDGSAPVAQQRRTSSSAPPASIASVRCSIRRVQLVARPVEREHARRHAQLLAPQPVGLGAQARAAARELERRARRAGGRSGGSRAAARGSRRASSACAAVAPLAVVQRSSTAARTRRSTRGGRAQVDERRAQVEPGAAGRGSASAPRARTSSIAACASAAYSPTEPDVVERPDADEAVRRPRHARRRVGWAVSTGSPRTGRIASAATISPPPRSASASAVADLPEAVGAEDGDDRVHRSGDGGDGRRAAERHRRRPTRSAPCGTSPGSAPAPGRSRSCSCGSCRARALDRCATCPRRAPHCRVPTSAWLRASAWAWIRSTSRSSRSCLTSSGTWLSMRRGIGAAARRVDERERVVVSDLVDDLERLAEVVLGLAGEADDDVGRQREARNLRRAGARRGRRSARASRCGASRAGSASSPTAAAGGRARRPHAHSRCAAMTSSRMSFGCGLV